MGEFPSFIIHCRWGMFVVQSQRTEPYSLEPNILICTPSMCAFVHSWHRKCKRYLNIPTYCRRWKDVSSSIIFSKLSIIILFLCQDNWNFRIMYEMEGLMAINKFKNCHSSFPLIIDDVLSSCFRLLGTT